MRRLFRFIDWVMDLPQPFELVSRDTLKDIEAENEMPYVTSLERLAKIEGKIEGKIQMLQELFRLPITSDAELDEMTADQLAALFDDLRKRFTH